MISGYWATEIACQSVWQHGLLNEALVPYLPNFLEHSASPALRLVRSWRDGKMKSLPSKGTREFNKVTSTKEFIHYPDEDVSTIDGNLFISDPHPRNCLTSDVR